MSTDIERQILELYDGYVHGAISRRDFLDRTAGLAVGGLSATAILESLLPDYVNALQLQPDDERLVGETIEYASPEGAGTMGGYLVRPAGATGRLPGVIVIHENRGLNPYIADVARRTALAGYLALAPDALYPLGGYPGNDDDGRELQRKRDGEDMNQDFIAAVRHLQSHPDCSSRVGCVGFCFGGGVCNRLAVEIPDLAAAVPFYGSQPPTTDVPRINAPLLLHYAENDPRINAGWPAYEAALEAAGKDYRAYLYEDTTHGFHNDTTPRYDKEAAELAWQRTLDFFEQHLR